MENSRKPLAKVEGRRRMRLSGLTVAWRGTPNLDDWVAYIANGTRSKKFILADHASERKVKGLLSRLQTLAKKDIEKLAKG
jgi:DNA polymerase III delta subunit